MKHFEIDATFDAYSLAVQVLGNAFIARRGMVGIEAGEFIDCVFSDAALALRGEMAGREVETGSPLGKAAALVIAALRSKA